MTITLPSPSSAIYLYADPDDFGTFNMKVTATAANGSTVSSGDVAVTNNACAGTDSTASGGYFGLYGTGGDKIASVTVTLDDPSSNSGDFAFGAFALADPNSQIVDEDLSLSGMPSDMSVDATSPAGAVLTYTAPTAVDEDSPASATVNCAQPSGSTFAIGTTTVTCTASDADDSNGPVSQSFNVTVVGAAGQLSGLAAAVAGVKPGTSLAGKVAAAQSAAAAGDLGTACQALDSFISEVAAQTGKWVPAGLAPSLLSDARQIEAVLGCAGAQRQPRAHGRSG